MAKVCEPNVYGYENGSQSGAQSRGLIIAYEARLYRPTGQARVSPTLRWQWLNSSASGKRERTPPR